MNYDRVRFGQLTLELDALHKREEEIVTELAKIFAGVGEGPGAVAPKAPSKPKSRAKGKTAKKGQLQKLVIDVLSTYKTPKSVADVAAKVQKSRPETTKASVATVLHQLAKRGKIVKTDPSTFFLPPATQSVGAPSAAAVADSPSTTDVAYAGVADEALES